MFTHLKFTGIFIIPLCIYLYYVIRRMLGVFTKDKKIWLQRGLSVILAVLITIPAIDFYSFWAAVVLHFAVISAIVDIVCLIIKKAGCRFPRSKETAWHSGGIAAAITLIVIGYAYMNMHWISATEYTVFIEKNIREKGYNIVFLSDLHFGTTMNQNQLKKYCAQMEDEKPDLVILGGDIVDESTSLTQVQEAFQTLGQIDSTYGIYYIYGNHDKGNYSDNCDFTENELSQIIHENGIRILEDETVILNDELSISGRQDRTDARISRKKRKSSKKLLQDIPDSVFHILADHQPRGMEKNEKAGYDLMLSGHTHAGQMWPVGVITTLFDKDTVNYGQKKFGNMELIVSSGIGGLGYPLRTGKHCEYVVVHIKQSEQA